MRALAALVLGAALAFAESAHAQSEPPPVPPEPEPERAEPAAEPAPPGARRAKKPVSPGFEEAEAPGEAAGDVEGGAGGTPGAEEDAARPRRRGRARAEPEEEDAGRPVSLPEAGPNERLIEDVRAATGEITLGELVEEILADVGAELDARPASWFSPMAIRRIALDPRIVPSYAAKLESAIIAVVHAGTDIRVVECVECNTTRTRLEEGQWVITRGVPTTAEMRRVAEQIGVKSFMDVEFGFDPATSVLEMSLRVVRAHDSRVLWSETFRADETTPLLMRSSQAPIRRKDRLRDLEMLLEGRPYFGYVATAGFMLLPHNDPIEGDIGGATAGYRIYERFGVDRRVMFGLDLTGFINTSRLAGGVISAGSWWIPLRPDLLNPELRLGAKAGAFIAGTAGNAAVFQLGAEVLLRYRFGLYAYVLFMTKSEFPPSSGNELGGVGMSTGMSFNW